MVEIGADAKKVAPDYPKVQWRGYGHYMTVSTMVNVRGEFRRFVLESAILNQSNIFGFGKPITELDLLQKLHESAFKNINEAMYNERWDDLITQ
jgi:hypothetical protein